MRTCGACKLPLRWDETLQLVYLDAARAEGGAGYYQACPRCVGLAEGAPPPPPRKYPVGRVPRHPYKDDYLPICALCREALYENEKTLPARVRAEDLAAGEGEGPGLYLMCPRCLARHRPQIAARVIAAGLFPPGTPVDAMPQEAFM